VTLILAWEILKKVQLKKTQRCGAAEARRAHNPDVPGSKPGIANFLSIFFSVMGHDKVLNLGQTCRTTTFINASTNTFLHQIMALLVSMGRG
jgi:predicted SnoaL-like aldol condensation-catalyzing enzyme